MLQSKDSVFVKGVVSDENGSFILNTPHQNGIVKVTCIGYRTVFLNVTDDNLGVIVFKRGIYDIRRCHRKIFFTQE